MKLKDYSQLAKISWSNGFVYRLNFVMWRVRLVVQLLAIYFFWLAILKHNQVIFDYNQAQLLTYILGTAVMRSLVFSSRSVDAQEEIASGDLNNYLIKPINYFRYWLTRDLADKLLNLVFTVGELTLIIWLLKPPLVLPQQPITWLVFIGVSILAMLLYFYFSFLVSMTTFWLPEQGGWPQRFFIFMLLDFFAGGLFPLDILPQDLYRIVGLLPTAFFMYTPLQVFLGRITGQALLTNLLIMVGWLVVFKKLADWAFQRGLKIYGAYGR